MPRLAVDPQGYAAASQVFGASLADGVSTTYRVASDVLAECDAMAGSDDNGLTWASGYDSAVEQVTGATQAVVNGCYKLASLLEATGFNHGAAESASVPGGVVPTVDRTNYDESVLLSSPPTAAGGSFPSPFGWSLVSCMRPAICGRTGIRTSCAPLPGRGVRVPRRSTRWTAWCPPR